MTPSRWARLKEIFGQAMEKPEPERSRFITAACGGDEGLRREVEGLLNHPSESGFLGSRLGGALEREFVGGEDLRAGQMLKHYRIEGKIGEGGMGAVYRATDTKLGREVAIKVLPEEFVRDPDRMARFRREAHILASLNHPNIASIYGLEDGALVMELVEGDTLRGPLPVETALAYARQITEALDYAHERGIIHRDLKPANLKITGEGMVKILDFGLAKIAEPAAEGENAEPPHTQTVRATEGGLILGTAGYMAPEQARGETVDRRADIWAFGVVLYEMLTGRRLFEGGTVSDTLAAVLTRDPDWSLLPAEAPEYVRRLLRRCLERDKKKRLRDFGDAWVGDTVAAEPGKPSNTKLPWAVATIFGMIAAVALWAPWRVPPPGAERPALRLDLEIGEPLYHLAVSPDGKRVAFTRGAAWSLRASSLAARRLDDDKISPLAGTEGAMAPFFSPDGHWIGFFAGGKLRKIAADGGAPITICEAPNGRGGSWGEDGYIVAALDVTGGLSRVPANGGKPELITGLYGETEDATSHRWPQGLPGGKGIIFTSLSGQQTSLWILKPGNARPQLLLKNAREARYVESGHLVYYNQGSLVAVPFDIDRLEPAGPSVSLVSGVIPLMAGVLAAFDVSRSGTLIYRRGQTDQMRVVSWLDSSGRTEPLLSNPGRYLTPSLSPDGKRLAITIQQGDGANVWVYDSSRDTMTPMPTGAEYQFHPAWTPDGEYLVFQSGGKLAWSRSDGSGRVEQLAGTRQGFPWSFSPDGGRLFFHQATGGHYDVWDAVMEASGGNWRFGEPRRLTHQTTQASYPAISPDGRWLAYSGSELNNTQIYVVALQPDGRIGGRKWQVSNNGGGQPIWSKNRRELFYSTRGQIMVVPYSSKRDLFMPEKPRLFSDRRLAFGTGHSVYDVAPDGKRIVALLDIEDQAEKPETVLRVILNVGDELRRRAAAGAK